MGYNLTELYEYSAKELLFILKYKREGLAYEIWRHGTMTRASRAKDFPSSVDKAVPELFEKEQGVPISQLPPEIQKMFVTNYQQQIDMKYNPN